MKRTRNFVRELKRLAKSKKKKGSQVVAAIGTSAIALATLAPFAQAQTTTYDPKFVNDLLSLTNNKIGANDFYTAVCDHMTAVTGSTQFQSAGSWNAGQVCNQLTTDPLYYSNTTPRFYKVKLCSSDPNAYYVVGNLLVQTGRWADPTAVGYWTGYSTNIPSPISMTIDTCQAAPSSAQSITYPAGGFVPAANPIGVTWIRRSFGIQNGSSIPENPLRPGIAYNIGSIQILHNYGSQNVTFMTTNSGDAVYGTDFIIDDSNGTVSTANSIFLPGYAPAGNGPFITGVNLTAKFNPVNHAAKTVNYTLTAPGGYTWIGSPSVVAQINPLQRSNVSITPNPGTTLTPGSTTNGFTLTRTGGDTTQALSVYYTVGGTASNGSDYGYLSGQAQFAANQTSLNIPIAVPTRNGSTAIPQKTVDIGLTTNDGYLNGSPTSASFTIPAYNPSTIAISATTTALKPGDSSNFTISRPSSADLSQPLTVYYSPTGSATPGTDYTQLPGVITIPANQTSVTVPFSTFAKTGTSSVAQKDLAITLQSGSGYIVPTTGNAVNYTIGAYTPSNVTITNPGGGTTPGGGTLTPGSTTDGFTVNRIGGDTTQPLIVNYLVGGTATPGSDYTPLSGVVTIPAGQTTATVPLQVLPNSGTTAKPAKDITITLKPGNGYTPDATNPTATYTIPAYTPPAGAPSITVSAPSGTTLTPGTTTNALTFTRTGSTTGNLPVYYKIGGTATSGSDYSGLSGQVTIPNGQSSVTVPISVPTTATTGKTIGVTLDVPGSMYSPGTNTQATYTIGNRPTTQTSIDVKFDPTVPQLVVTRIGGDQNQPISVPLTIGGDALPGVDYTKIPDTVNFPSGQNVVKIPLELLSGAKPGRRVVVAVPGGGTDTYTIPPTGTTTTTTTTTKKDNSGGGGSALAPIAGVAGVGGILAASGVFSSGGLAAAASGFAAVPDYCTQAKGDIAWDILPGTNGGIIFARPDVTFSHLGYAYTKGKVKVKGQTVAWGGQGNAATPADALNLGNLDGVYNLQCLNLAQIEKASGKKLSDKPLGETGLMRQTTFVNLTKTAYQKAKTVGDVPGLAEMLFSKLPQSVGLTKDAIAKMSFAELLEKVPQLAQVNLGSIAIGEIPGFMQVPLANFSDWKNFAVSEVPGLADVPFSQFPTKPAESKPADATNKTSQR